jgi:hypothetical protein
MLRLKSYLVVVLFLLAPLSVSAAALVIDHNFTKLYNYSQAQYQLAKDTLHIAYGHTSHGSQVTTGMASMVGFINGGGLGMSMPNNFFSYNNGGTGGALDLHDNFESGDLGGAWASSTRSYLNDPSHSDTNVVMWSWCGQVSDASADYIVDYLTTMNQLETDYPDVTFVYMTGHVDGTAIDSNLHLRNQQIRDFVLANGKVLFDFADIESWDPDGIYYGDKLLLDNLDYDSDGNGTRDKNWAVDWRAAHSEGVDWFDAYAAHSDALNANVKAYAAWALFAEIAAANSSPVPIPGAVWLFGSGLIGMFGIRRKYKGPFSDI